MYVEMELSRVVISEMGGDQLVFLRERNGQREFPIRIGIYEALAVHRRLNGEKTPRPMTHDLLAGVIRALGGSLERIVIEDLTYLTPEDTSQTFIATIYIRRDGEVVPVDSRPSDALALGAALNTPIYVAEKVLHGVSADTKEERLGMLREYREALARRIADLHCHLANTEFLDKTSDEQIHEARNQLRQMQAEFEAIERILKAQE